MLLVGLLGGLILAMVISRSKKTKHESDDDNLSTHNSQQSNDASVDAKVVEPKRKSKQDLKEGESSGTNTFQCRFCGRILNKPQALGGHMNRHRKERENEEHQKALNLVTQRDQQYAGALWNMQGAVAGSLHHGGNLLVNSPSMPHFTPPQPSSTQQNWSQLQQPMFSMQPQQEGGINYHNPNARLQQGLPSHPQPHHIRSFQLNQVEPSPLEEIMVRSTNHQPHHTRSFQLNQVEPSPLEEIMVRSTNHQPHHTRSFQLNQVEPSPLEEIMVRSTNHQIMQSNNINPFIGGTSQNNIQFVDRYGNPPLNETHNFQGVQVHYNQEETGGTSALGSLGSDEVNQIPLKGPATDLDALIESNFGLNTL